MSEPSVSYYRRIIIKKSFFSAKLQMERKLLIHLPPGYNELLSYPVVYCQDGLEFFNFGRIATQAARLVLEEGMEPSIIVGVEVDKERRNEEYGPEGLRFAAYCDFFTEELIPYVEAHFPARSSSEERILAGDSLGATVSLHLALDYPHLFTRAILLSGAFRAATQARIHKAADLTPLKLYMLIGLQETDVSTPWGSVDFVALNRETKALLESAGAQVTYKEADGLHLWGFWQKHLPEALLHFL